MVLHGVPGRTDNANAYKGTRSYEHKAACKAGKSHPKKVLQEYREAIFAALQTRPSRLLGMMTHDTALSP